MQIPVRFGCTTHFFPAGHGSTCGCQVRRIGVRGPNRSARVRRAEMVKALIESVEYRNRFLGAPEGNQQGLVEAANAWRNE